MMNSNSKKRLWVVICGWHFKYIDFYQKLVNELLAYPSLESACFIASHKNESQINPRVLRTITQLGYRVLYFENKGWDWGAYQQFLEWQNESVGRFSDYYLFLHDDIVIKNGGFIGAFIGKTEQGALIVGNSYLKNDNTDFARFYPEDLEWARLRGFPIISKKWDIVRGSCFFAVREVVEEILLGMPIQVSGPLSFANRSLRVFGGLVSDRYGCGSVEYLSAEPRDSVHIEEELRGAAQPPLRAKLRAMIPGRLKGWAKRMIGKQKAPLISEGTGMRLNLGCGSSPIPGYLNVDANSDYADLTSNILDLVFTASSIAEVLMVHTIEHIDYQRVEPFLREVHTWLTIDGRLIMEFPDVVKVCKLILKMKNKPDDLQESKYGLRGLYGAPTESMHVYDYHKWGWSTYTMVPLLRRIGFRKVYVEWPRYHASRKRDTRIVAIK